jgi:hypothetical protein
MHTATRSRSRRSCRFPSRPRQRRAAWIPRRMSLLSTKVQPNIDNLAAGYRHICGESAEVAPPPAGRPHPFLRVGCPTDCSLEVPELASVDVTEARSRAWQKSPLNGPSMACPRLDLYPVTCVRRAHIKYSSVRKQGSALSVKRGKSTDMSKCTASWLRQKAALGEFP